MMTTTKPEQKWYIVDAKDKVAGRIATKIADKLRGKDKPTFVPYDDKGAHVIVINASKIKLTGDKLKKKMYITHSGFPGGFKQSPAEKVMAEKPTKVIELAVRGMLPRNKLRNIFMKKLKVYAGEEHPHTAQQPEELKV